MPDFDINNMTMKKKQDTNASLPSLYSGKLDLLKTLGRIKWSNKHDCPAGYNYNEDGFVVTNENHLQISVNMMPYILTTLGEYQTLYQNTLALRVLNPNKQQCLVEEIIKYKFSVSFGRKPNTDILNKAIENAYAEISLSNVIANLHRSIFSFQSIWYSKDCSIGGRKQIYGILRDEYIDSVRSVMPIDTKFKTRCVADTTSESDHVVNVYWKHRGLDRKARSIHAMMEALEKLVDEGSQQVSIKSLCDMSGLSRNTIVNIIDK